MTKLKQVRFSTYQPKRAKGQKIVLKQFVNGFLQTKVFNCQILPSNTFQPETILDKDKRGQNVLHYCAENQNLNCIEQIIEADPDLLNQTDEEGYTPLHLAVISGNSAIVKFLISKGANVNAVDNEKHSAIHWATGKTRCFKSTLGQVLD